MSTATKGTGVFQPRYGLMAQQEKKSQHSSTKSSCEPTDSAMTPIVLALQQQLHLQQMQRGAGGHARRSSVCSNSNTCVSSGSFASGGSLSPAAAGSPLLSPCHSSSLSALASPFATSSVNCMNAPQCQQLLLPPPQLCYEPLMVPVDLGLSQRNNQLEQQQLLLLEQQEAALDAAIQQLLTCRQHLAVNTPVANNAPVAPFGMPCPFPAPVSPMVPTSSWGPLATAQLLEQQQCTPPPAAFNVSSVTAQLLAQQLQFVKQRLQTAEDQLQQQLQAEMLHLLDLVA